MPAPILPELLDLFPDTVTVEEPLGFTTRGVPTGYASAKTYRARVLGSLRMVRGADGQERVSSMQILVGSSDQISQKARITLPARFTPRTPTVITVRPATDENGPHHSRIYCL